MILAGLAVLVVALAPLFELITGTHLHLPDIRATYSTRRGLALAGIALIAAGIYLSSLANRRFGLRIQTSDKSFTWKPPLFVVDKPSRFRVASALKDMLQTCQQAGLRVFDGHQH
jgi:hypothetical protein